MAKNTSPGLAEKALSSAERHGRSLQSVNEKLADLVASLRDQKQRLSTYSQPVAPQQGVPAAERATPRDPAGARDAADETAELASAREALRLRDEEDARLRARLAEIETENRRVGEEFAAIQMQNAELVALYAAVEQLHGAPTRSDVLTAIQEILINVVGSEEFELFETGPGGDRLVPAHGFGVEARKLEPIAVGDGSIGRAAASGRPWVAGEDAGDDPPLAACVPLRIGERLAGAVAIYSFLGHKPAVTDLDRAIFEMLERHAALALHLREPRRAGGAR